MGDGKLGEKDLLQEGRVCRYKRDVGGGRCGDL